MNALYQKTILEHARQPKNRRTMERPDFSGEGRNPSCGDRLVLFLKLDGQRITEAAFQGTACAVAQASASMMTEALAGKTLAEAGEWFRLLRRAVETGKTDARLGNLSVLAAVHVFPSRKPCALLPWEALRPILPSCKTKPPGRTKNPAAS